MVRLIMVNGNAKKTEFHLSSSHPVRGWLCEPETRAECFSGQGGILISVGWQRASTHVCGSCLRLIEPCSRRSIGLYFLSRLGHTVPAHENFRKRRHDT